MCEGGGLVHDPMVGHVDRYVVGEEVGLVHDRGCFNRMGRCVVGEEGRLVYDSNSNVLVGTL